MLALVSMGCDDGGESEQTADTTVETDASADAGSDDQGVDANLDAAAGDSETSDANRGDAAQDVALEDGALADADLADADLTDSAPAPDMGARQPFTACTDENRVGAFVISLENGFTAVQGQVTNAVNPARVPVVAEASGTCALLQPPTLFCEPSCGAGMTCGADGCVATPSNIDVGTVTVEGLKAPVSMTASAPVWFYTNLDPLDHPGFDPGADIQLAATGADPIAPFSAVGWGVTPLVVTTEDFVLERGTPASIVWETPADTGPATILIDLNIANHGGTPGRIECLLDDTGAFEIPAALVERLLDQGFSGFPSLEIVRRSADSALTAAGCVGLRVESSVVLDVTIPGLTSCSGDEDCPEDEFCQGDLTCGDGQ